MRKVGASDDEIKSAMLDGAAVRMTASQIMANFAFDHIGLKDLSWEPAPTVDGHPVKVLVAVGAAFTVNCVVSLEKYLVTAKRADISKEDIGVILELPQKIKGRTAHHVERLGRVTRDVAKSEARQQ